MNREFIMDVNRFTSPLEMELGHSGQMRAYLIGIHLLAVVVLLIPMALPWWSRSLLLLACCYSYWIFSRSWFWEPVVRGIAWHGREDWSVGMADGRWIDVSLVGEQLVLSWLVMMQLADQTGKRYTLIVLPDMLARDQFRHLRTRLLGEAAQDFTASGR